ncbi:MAG: hypothetical protein L3J46_10135, partial [Kangiellaceae bacterium]|nr:hypothetical protein [Kangiellaceae bacterium]
ELPGVAGIADENHLCYHLYFEVGVVQGQLTFRVTYSDQLFKLSTIEMLSEGLVSAIERRISELGY